MTFIKDGIKYTAGHGSCEAIQLIDNKIIFQAFNVWKDKEPAEDQVLALIELFKAEFADDIEEQNDRRRTEKRNRRHRADMPD